MCKNLRSLIKNIIPNTLLNSLLLTFPKLYKLKLINYETNLVSNKGIKDLQSQLDVATSLPGDIIECGSSRCGASIIMANFLRENSIKKTIFALDSFEGFDLNELKREKQLGLVDVGDDAFTSTSYEYVKRKLTVLDLLDIVKPIKGYFQNTLSKLNDRTFCLALVDCDLNESIIYCAETIWPKLIKGGRIVFDDYNDHQFRGAKIGVDYFINKYKTEIYQYGLLNRLYYVVKK
jgi:hypothetical protein